ncbi:hypothetical protein H312_00059 [Anncaliia algerae PRA339]|uniref:Uncharacterized protein n=1 Tax=Anncaliia algerae PRA339 TaxID=1288291 RepID=A0A059F5Z8_9MICR|nr:hypothetical protein H312_00059 [Anncaliia algerae PRA339]
MNITIILFCILSFSGIFMFGGGMIPKLLSKGTDLLLNSLNNLGFQNAGNLSGTSKKEQEKKKKEKELQNDNTGKPQTQKNNMDKETEKKKGMKEKNGVKSKVKNKRKKREFTSENSTNNSKDKLYIYKVNPFTESVILKAIKKPQYKETW